MMEHKFEEIVKNAPKGELGNAAIALATDYAKQIITFVGGSSFPELLILAAVFGHLEYIFRNTAKRTGKMMGHTVAEIEEDKKTTDAIKTILNSISTNDIMAFDNDAVKREMRCEDEQE